MMRRDPRSAVYRAAVWARRFRAGDWVTLDGTPRLVLGVHERYIAFRKLRGSWTDPNPAAWYSTIDVRGRLRLIRPASANSRRLARRLAAYEKA